MAAADLPFSHGILDRFRELQETQEIRDRRPVLPDFLRHFFLGVPAFVDQPLVGDGDLDRVEVFPLEVFDERQLEHLFV